MLVVLVSFALTGTARAQDHTLVILSHRNHTVYELDPATGKILHEFVAPDQPHEGAVTPDGGTIFASVPAAAFVQILDAKTFKERGRIESEYFKRPPQARRTGRDGSPPGPPNTSASPHGVALNNDNSKLYVGTENAEVPGVVVYDVKSGKVIKKIDLLLRGGHYLQIQPGTDKLYLADVAIVDLKTMSVAARHKVGTDPFGGGMRVVGR
jgi:DNA-binding beta-propeller fold protein YncE